MKLAIALLVLAVSGLNVRPEKEATATFPELCTYHGYEVEEHKVTTIDGYILTLFRIPGRTNETSADPKPVAFMQHGLLDLSFTWITNDPELAPGFVMADSGFDVWFGNSRGNYFSTAHVSLDPKKDAEFWQFSWQQMAEYDLPAVITYVLGATGQSKLTYIGHSQGTLQMFALLSEHPDFAANLSLFVALGPVATVKHINNRLINEAAELHVIEVLIAAGVHDFMPYPGVPTLAYAGCTLLNSVCASVIEALADQVISEDNTERFPVILAHEPGGTSVHNMKHWSQMVDLPEYRVQKFNYGDIENLRVYGQISPPVYNLTNIVVPTALFIGEDDRLADETDAHWLLTQLRPETVVYVDDTLKFGHLTFVWGKDMSYLKKVVELARQFA